MANKELFKQAIAEAKSVREAAIANAKIAMEESLTPHLKELLAQRLAEMEEAEEMEEEENHMEEETHVEDPAEAKEVYEEAEDDSEESEEEAKEESEEDEEIEDMTVEDLKELIRDILSQEMQNMPEEEEEMENMEAEEEEMDMVSADDEEINIDEILAELAEMEEEDHIEEGLKDKLSAIYNDPEVLGKLITVDGKKMSLKDFLSMAGGATAGSMAGGGKASQAPGSGDIREEDITEELDEALDTIEKLRKDLNEVNLLNAKLLYVNKIFKANNLDESQKVGIIAAFDKAETVKEAKLVFESVSTNIAPKKKETVKEHKSFASRSAGVAPKKEVISEASDIVKRMQKLAGII